MRRIIPLFSIFLLIVLSTTSAWAINENQYQTLYDTEVLPWARQASLETFNGKKGKDIAYICYHKPGAQDVIIIANGRTESIPKYFETAYDLYHSDLLASVCLYDHRGQGLSERLISDARKGHVEYFSYYVDDLKNMVQRTKLMGYTHAYVWGHSMGGAVAVRTAQRYPSLISGLVLSAPMLALNTDPYPESVTYALASTMVWFWMGENFIPGKTYYEPTGSDVVFNENYVTRSRVRWQMTEDQFLVHGSEWPQAPLGGGTARWLREAIKASWKISWGAYWQSTPTILFQSGEEKYVAPESQVSFCNRTENCELFSFQQESYRDSNGNLPRHELMMETDSVRDEFLQRAIQFMKDRGVPTHSCVQQH